MAEIETLHVLQGNQHPNIIEFLGCVVQNGRITGSKLRRHPVTLMARMESDEWSKKPFDEEGCFRGIAHGIDHLHSLGFAHNDINPANIVLDINDKPIIIDFGSSMKFGEELQEHGTPGWNEGFEDVSSLKNDEIGMHKLSEFLGVTDEPNGLSATSGSVS